MSNNERRWWINLAWLFVVAAFVVGILGLLTIGKFILPFAFLGLYLVLKWGGDRGGTVVGSRSVHPLDLPVEIKGRIPVASGAALWTILGAVVATHGLSAVDSKVRPYIVAVILIATLDGIAATLLILQGKRRKAILLLFATIIFPTHFFWVVRLIPVALAGCLLISPFMTPLRDLQAKRRQKKFRRKQDN